MDSQELSLQELERLVLQIKSSQSWSESESAIQGFRSFAHELSHNSGISDSFALLKKEAEESSVKAQMLKLLERPTQDWTSLTLAAAGEKIRAEEEVMAQSADAIYGESSELIGYSMGIRRRLRDLFNKQINPAKPYAQVLALPIYESYFNAREPGSIRALGSPNHYPYDYELLLKICEPILVALQRESASRVVAESKAPERHGYVKSFLGYLRPTVAKMIGTVITAGLIWFFGFNGTRSNPEQQRRATALAIDKLLRDGENDLSYVLDDALGECPAVSTSSNAVKVKIQINSMRDRRLKLIDSATSETRDSLEGALLQQNLTFNDFGHAEWLAPEAKRYENFIESSSSAKDRVVAEATSCLKSLDRAGH